MNECNKKICSFPCDGACQRSPEELIAYLQKELKMYKEANESLLRDLEKINKKWDWLKD